MWKLYNLGQKELLCSLVVCRKKFFFFQKPIFFGHQPFWGIKIYLVIPNYMLKEIVKS